LAKDILKLRLYPAILIALVGVGLAVLLSRFSITTWIEPMPPDSVVTTPAIPSPSASAGLDSVRSPSPQSTPQSTPLPQVSASSTPITSTSDLDSTTAQLGKLRVSNQTNQPIRIALLPLESLTSDSGSTESNTQPPQPVYSEPVHWDFAPQEGSAKGLLLSLPDGNLQIRRGDILVAFAQDGSRRYWGPYVVGETALPTWDGETAEWLLRLIP
jgi:hypothetical protein